MHLVIFFPMQLSSTAFLAASTSGSSGIVLNQSLWLLSMEFSRVAFLFSCYSHDILCVFFYILFVVPLHVSRAVKWASPARAHRAKTYTGLKWVGSLRPKVWPVA
jgi:hypothetical protein